SQVFLTFGHCLVDPVYAGLAGVWDSLYSTLWADGMLSGSVLWDTRPPWNYTLMSACAILSIPPTIALCVGLIRAAWDKCLRFAAIFLGVFLLTLLHLYLTLPVYTTAKA